MELLYPISTELFTFVHALNREVEVSLRRECDLSVVQYRVLSCLMQEHDMDEHDLIEVLCVSPSQLSQGLSEIAAHNYIAGNAIGGPSKHWELTDVGRQAVRNADLVLIEACNRIFEPLGPDLGSAIRAGSMLTNQRHGIVRTESGSFFPENACFEAFLEAERITKQSAHKYGFTETEFRILFELLCSGPTSKSQLSKTMKLARSTVTDVCRKLEGDELICKASSLGNKKTHVMALTEQGRMKTEEAAVYVDRRAMGDIRPSSDEERALYQKMANIISGTNR